MVATQGAVILPHWLTQIAVALHVGFGTLALISGVVAVTVRKCGPLHRSFGTVFFLSMLGMAVFADYLAVAMPDQIVNVFIGTFTLYLVTTAWLAVRRPEARVGAGEKVGLSVILVLFAPFAILSFQIVTGIEPLFKSAVPFEGPVLIAIYSFTVIIAIAMFSDLKVILSGGIAGARRIERHLWRMCLGLTLASGSAFTNGLPRLLPHGVHIPLLWLFVPQLSALALLIFWMIRVRFTGWYQRQ